MTEEQEKDLKEALRLSKENNKFLRKMESRRKWSRFFKAVIFVFVLIAVLSAYYYLQPLISEVSGIIDQASESLDKIKGANEIVEEE